MLSPFCLIEIAGRLIHNDDGGTGGQGPSDRHALLLTAGELIGLVPEAMSEPHQVEQLLGANRWATGMFSDVERYFDVFLGGQGRNEIECLKDHTDLLVADRGQLPLAEVGDIHTVDQDPAAGRVVQSGDDAQQRRLARARRARRWRQTRRD